MQLVAYGAQDIYLTGNPQITFFKVVYRRHTNFAMESIEQTFSGLTNFGNKVVCTIARNGDLVSNIILEVDLTIEKTDQKGAGGTQLTDNDFKHIRGLGHKMIKYVEVSIGGQRIDRHYGEWMDIWTQLSLPAGKLNQLTSMIDGSLPNLEDLSESVRASLINTDGGEIPSSTSIQPPMTNVRRLYIPLQFWFNRNPGLALPLIALQYHEVKIQIEFAKKEEIRWCIPQVTFPARNDACGNNCNVNGCSPCLTPEDKCWDVATFNPRSRLCRTNIDSASLYCNYIFLDTDEIRRFAQVSHEYLIDQLQRTSQSTCPGYQSSTVMNIPIEFNHPVKALYWVAQRQAAPLDGGMHGQDNILNRAYTYDFTVNHVGNPQTGVETDSEFIESAKIQLNGNDRFRERDGSYFRLVQPYQHVGWAPDQGRLSSVVKRCCNNLANLCSDTDNKLIKYQNQANPEKGYISMYSFGLKPLEHQPSGTCNFSRIDNANLLLKIRPRGETSCFANPNNCAGGDNGATVGCRDSSNRSADNTFSSLSGECPPGTQLCGPCVCGVSKEVDCSDVQVRVYANNYNVLRIMSGMGGLAYSN
jgi:hypothetical protein